LESAGVGVVVSEVREVFRLADLFREGVLDSDILLSDANLLLLLPVCPAAAVSKRRRILLARRNLASFTIDSTYSDKLKNQSKANQYQEHCGLQV
jgi:hypothetical protein